MKTQHTPWKVKSPRTGNTTSTIMSGDNKIGRIYSKDHAELIVKTVNSHYELLEACKTALEYRKQTHHGDDKVLAILTQAIKKAL